MQVSVESTGSLGRKITVEVPAEQIENAVDARLRDLSRTVKMDGFRPGKAPLKVIKRKFDARIRQEVVGEVLQRSLYEAIQQENLKPAGGPRIESMQAEPGQALHYSASFEVYPEIQLASLQGKTIERPVVEISDQDVDKMFEKLQAQRATFNDVDRTAQEGDQLIISFKGSIDGAGFGGNQADNTPLVLGSGTMVPGFEDQLLGVRAGEEKTIEITFPEDYAGKEVAGKTAQFEIKVSAVQEAKLPAIDDEFAKGFGVEEGLAKFREEVRHNMERELKEKIRTTLKTRVLDALSEANPLELPQALVDEEIDNLMQQALGNRPEVLKNLNLPRNLFEERARKRVALGLLVGEVIRANQIQTDQDRLRSKLEEIAESYEQPAEVIKAYRDNRNLMQSLEGLVLEDQVVELLQSQADIEDQKLAFDEFMKN